MAAARTDPAAAGNPLLDAIAAAIAAATGQPFVPAGRVSAGSGSIHSTFILDGRDSRRFFIKYNHIAERDNFAAEMEGLRELQQAAAIRVPRPICAGEARGLGKTQGQAFLVLEYLAIGACGSATASRLGESLAALHRVTAPRFGWRQDNFIGATPQINRQTDDWCEFWRERRLRFQMQLAARCGASPTLLSACERLLLSIPCFFSDYSPQPSLLHGDLWGGNQGCAGDEPVLFDPAVYYGDREADLAMSELFGGFPPAFYAAYRAAWPLDPGYRVRKELYNLYHLLNHYNLFGGSYAAQAENAARRLLAELG